MSNCKCSFDHLGSYSKKYTMNSARTVEGGVPTGSSILAGMCLRDEERQKATAQLLEGRRCVFPLKAASHIFEPDRNTDLMIEVRLMPGTDQRLQGWILQRVYHKDARPLQMRSQLCYKAQQGNDTQWPVISHQKL